MGYIPSFGTALRVVSGVLVVSLISTAGLLFRYQTSLIYPSSFPSGSKAEVSTPDEYDLPYTEEELITPDSEKLRVFVMLQGTKLGFRKLTPTRIQSLDEEKKEQQQQQVERKSTPTQTGSTAVEVYDEELAKSRPTVLFLHANAGNMGHRLPLAAVFFKRFGCNVVMLSYRGYGFSTGSPNERGIKIDTQTTLDFIRSHPSLSSTILVAYGQSIGGAVAIDLAARNPASVHALILENTSLSIPQLIPHVLPPVRLFAFLCREYWNSGEAIRKISPKVPTLFLSGRQDELVPPSHMDALHERCKSKVKVFKQIKEGTHNDTCIKAGYFEAVGEFLLAHVVTLVKGRVAAEQEENEPEKKPSPRREGSGDEESDDWVQMSHSEVRDEVKVKEAVEKKGTIDADAPTLSKAPGL